MEVAEALEATSSAYAFESINNLFRLYWYWVLIRALIEP